LFGLPASAVAGLPGGAGFALLALGIVLLYRMAGVVSFAQNGFGVFGALVFVDLQRDAHVPFGLALLLGLLLSAVLCGVLGWAMARWFANRSALIRSAVTIAVAVCLTTAAERIFGSTAPDIPALVPRPNFRVGSTQLPANTIFAVVLAIVIAVGLEVLLRTTRLGVWLRAISERAHTAQLLGVRVTQLTVGVWAVSGAFAAVALILLAPTVATDPADLASASIEAFAAALIAGLTNLGVAVIAALVIGVFEGMAVATPSLSSYQQLVPLIAIILVLLWSKRGEVWGEAR
jgi:branched-chain amino acid transport system permease protein